MAVTMTSIRLDTDFADEAVKVLKAKSRTDAVHIALRKIVALKRFKIGVTFLLCTRYCTRYRVLGTVSFAGDDADIGEIAIAFRVVEAVADYEFVGNGEANIIADEREFAAGGLVEQSGYF
jgi:hypothetical protein